MESMYIDLDSIESLINETEQLLQNIESLINETEQLLQKYPCDSLKIQRASLNAHMEAAKNELDRRK